MLYLIIILNLNSNMKYVINKDTIVTFCVFSLLISMSFQQDLLSKLQKPSKCEGVCVSIDMNFPTSDQFNPFNTYNNWYKTNGSPNTSPNEVRIWAMDKQSEGVGLKYDFKTGYNYCISHKFNFNTFDSSTPDSSSIFNIQLFPSSNIVSYNFTPPTAINSQSLISYPLTSFIQNQDYTQNFNFNSNANHQTLSFSLSNQSQTGFFLRLKELTICEITNTPSPCLFKLYFTGYLNCNRIILTPTTSLQQGLSITGYIWEFGDGESSNEYQPIHFYKSSGVYTVTLTVVVSNVKGECCSKKVQYEVKINECDLCKQLLLSNIIVSNLGSFYSYQPSIYHHPEFVYLWTFSNGITYSTREVIQDLNNSFSYVSLNIYYSISDQCCIGRYNSRLTISPTHEEIINQLTSDEDLIFTSN